MEEKKCIYCNCDISGSHFSMCSDCVGKILPSPKPTDGMQILTNTNKS